MKARLVALVCLISLTVLAYTNVLEAGLVAYWPFDEGKGEVVADTSENHLDGKQVSCEWVEGKFNDSALQFNKAGSHVEIPYNEALDLQVFTIEFWTKYIRPPAEHSSFMSNRGWLIGNKMTGWTIRDHDGNLYLEILTRGQFQTDGGLAAGDWTFNAITYDDSHQAKLYINGELKKEQQIPGDILYSFRCETPLRLGFLILLLGFSLSGGDILIRLFLRVLSSGQIKQTYQNRHRIFLALISCGFGGF